MAASVRARLPSTPLALGVVQPASPAALVAAAAFQDAGLAFIKSSLPEVCVHMFMYTVASTVQASPLAPLATLEEYLALLAAVEVLPASTVAKLATQVVDVGDAADLENESPDVQPLMSVCDGPAPRASMWNGPGVLSRHVKGLPMPPAALLSLLEQQGRARDGSASTVPEEDARVMEQFLQGLLGGWMDNAVVGAASQQSRLGGVQGNMGRHEASTARQPEQLADGVFIHGVCVRAVPNTLAAGLSTVTVDLGDGLQAVLPKDHQAAKELTNQGHTVAAPTFADDTDPEFVEELRTCMLFF